jgi:hypothetical protein
MVLEQIAQDASVRGGEAMPALGRSGLQSRRDQIPAPSHQQPRTVEKPVSSRPITKRWIWAARVPMAVMFLSLMATASAEGWVSFAATMLPPK